jgi:nitroreductase
VERAPCAGTVSRTLRVEAHGTQSRMRSDSLYEVMRCAPSTRRFTGEPVAREALERVLDSARYAPSGGNRQGWRVVVVTDPDTRRRLRELYEPAWDAYTERTGARAILNQGEAGGVPSWRLRMLRGADEFAHNFDSVPVHLVVCVAIAALTITDSELRRPSIVGGGSIYPFVQNILLAVRAEGLGGAFTTLLIPAEEEVKGLLGIPDGMALAAHIAVGHRADPWPKRLTRNPVSEFAFAERWGEAW